MFSYIPTGVCSRKITFEVENDILTDVKFDGGCPGNLLGITSLVKNMPIKDVIKKLKGIRCGFKNTSCPDQLCHALEEYLKSNESK